MNRLLAAARRPRAYTLALLGVVLIGSLLGAQAASQADVVLPGVSVGGIPVAGLESAELVARLETPARAIERRQMTLVAGDRSWRISPLDLGVRVDVRRSAEGAFEAGREDVAHWVSRTFGGGDRRLSWVPSVDRGRLYRALGQLSRQINLEAANGDVRFEGSNVVVRPPVEGVTLLERPAAHMLLRAAITPPIGDRLVLPTRITHPSIGRREVARIETQARLILSAPVTFTFHSRRLSLPPARVAATLRVRAVPAPGRREGSDHLVLEADPEKLRKQIVAVAPWLVVDPRDASFELAGEQVRVIPSADGSTVVTDQAAVELAKPGAGSPRPPIELTSRVQPPSLTTKAAQELRIVEQVSTFTTIFDPTNIPRVSNIDHMASAIDGRIIRPNEVFSLNRSTGPRTPEKGYKEAQVIVDGEMVPGIGGGVCQVGTTLFNAVSDAGLEILERWNHSLYISKYPTGRDATVNYGLQDLRFRNDTPHGVLLRAAVNDKALIVSVYSTRAGRLVEYTTSEQRNSKEPAVKYVDDPTLPKGQEVVVEEGKPGFDITIIRKVTRGTETVHLDTFVSKYRPWKRIVRRGTGPPAGLPGSQPAPAPQQ